ncbi:MAG TPA: tetratricopeptide repeat protein [Pyrinomonadaceae bacterium]
MKRCPQCNRLESDDTLAFCRVDGSSLLPVTSEELGTVKFNSGAVNSDVLTTMLSPQNTGDASTAETTILSADQSRPITRELKKPRKLRWIAVVAILVIAGAGVCAYFLLSKKNRPPIQSIAVMPFINDSGNADVDYLSDGMTDTLISQLSQLTNLNVKARSSVFRYKGKETTAQTVGKELNVQAVLNGRFAQRGDQLILTLELVDAQTENVIWSEQYNRSQSDLVKLQTDIARDVSSKLTTKLSGEDAQKLAKTYTNNPEAYRLYLQGRFYWAKREEKDVKTAIDYFTQAIAQDANYALAYSGLADSYAVMGTFNFMTPTDAIPKARGFALKAQSLDASLAEPHTTLGLALSSFDYDFAAAEREYKRAIQLNPNYATAHQWYGELLSLEGRFDEASAELHRALDLEPLSQPINWDYGRFLYNSRKFDEALEQLKKTSDLDPGFARAHRSAVEVYRVKKDYSNAMNELAKYYELRGQPENVTLVRDAFAKGGWSAYLQLVVADDSPLKDRNGTKARAYTELGDFDKAFEQLNAAYDAHESTSTWLKVEPLFDPLRSDPRYQELLQKLRIP